MPPEADMAAQTGGSNSSDFVSMVPSLAHEYQRPVKYIEANIVLLQVRKLYKYARAQ